MHGDNKDIENNASDNKNGGNNWPWKQQLREKDTKHIHLDPL